MAEREEEQEYLGVEILETVQKQTRRLEHAAERIEHVIGMLDKYYNDLEDLKLILKGMDENMHRLNENQIKLAKQIGLDAENDEDQ